MASAGRWASSRSAVSARRAGREIELKLEVRAQDLPHLLHHPRLLELAEGTPRRRSVLTVYYDTPDLALWRSGLVLRVRRIGRRLSVGVKTRGVVRGGLVARDELETPLAAAGLDPRRVARSGLLGAIAEPRLRRALERAAGGEPLAPRVETRFRRSALRVRLGSALVELALDEGEARAGRARIPIRELELELLAGATRALFDLALELATEFELQPSSLGKAERAFERLLGEAQAPAHAEPIQLARNASLEAALRSVLGECVRHLTANRSAAQHRTDPEGVHQMRVGARRLRSALRLFEAWLPPRVTLSLAGELRWLGRELGRARDLDVFVTELLGSLERSLPEDAGLEALHEAAEAARAEAHAAVRAALSSQRYALLVLRLGRFIEGTPFRRGGLAARQVSALRAARPLLRRLATELHELGARIDRLSARELHRLRIRTKRLRYAIELIGPLFGEKSCTRAERRLAALQDRLGYLNDLASAEALLAQLRDRLGAKASPATARAEGRVLSHAAAWVAAGRAELSHAWRRVARSEPFWESQR